ncbi:MAG: hypothetical protein IT361_10235 [Gemmatimonadaceae bacterium]|nr:hypothetical protein [Gemmatimonadaceae bacterium]
MRLVHERRQSGASLAQVARELDVRADLLQRLRREVAVLRQEQAFAKKVAVNSIGRRYT